MQACIFPSCHHLLYPHTAARQNRVTAHAIAFHTPFHAPGPRPVPYPWKGYGTAVACHRPTPLQWHMAVWRSPNHAASAVDDASRRPTRRAGLRARTRHLRHRRPRGSLPHRDLFRSSLASRRGQDKSVFFLPKCHRYHFATL